MKQRMFLFTAILLIVSTAFASAPQALNIQGRLRDNSNNIVANGDYALRFRFYTVPTGGSYIFEENQTLGVSAGFFDAIIGSNSTLNLGFNETYYVGIVVSGEEMAPRLNLTSAPYARTASNLWTDT